MLTIQPASEFIAGESVGLFDLDEKTYRGAPGLSQSVLRLALNDPYHVIQSNRCPMVATAAMELGTLAHILILTPELYGNGKSHVMQPKEYPSEDKKGAVTMKPWSGNSNWCKAWKEENEDNLILTPKDQRTVEQMADSFKAHPFGAALLANGFKEVSCFWIDEETGLMMKARFDIIAENADDSITIVDLKKVGQDDEHSFKNACADLDYPIQNATYRTGAAIVQGIPLDRVQFIHASLPDKAPHCIDWRKMGANTMRKGEENMRKAINKYAEAKKSGQWTTIQEFECPDWYLSR